MKTTRLLSGLLGVVVMLTVMVLLSGCTSAVLRLPGGASLLQPKDVTLKGLYYTSPDGSSLIVDEYTSSANVGAIQAQAALTQGLVQTAIQTALSAAVPVAATANTPAQAYSGRAITGAVGGSTAAATSGVSTDSAAAGPTPAVGVLAADGTSLTAVETTRIVPAK